MNMKHTASFIALFMLLTSISATAQYITGTPSVCTGTGYSYTLNSPAGVTSTWSATNGIVTGSGYTRTVTWSNSGVLTVKEYEPVGQSQVLVSTSTYNVTIKTAGTISSVSSVCSGASFTLSNSGAVSGLTWQWSNAGAGSWNTLGTSAANGSISTSQTAAKDYRAKLTECTSTYSNVKTVNMYVQLSAAGSIGGSSTICAGSTPATLTNSASPTGENYAIQWQQRIGAGSWTNISGATSLTYSPPALTTTTDYRRYVSWTCNTGINFTSNTVTVTVNPATSTGVVASSASKLCVGGVVTISAASLVSTSTQWQVRYSDNNGSSYGSWTTYSTSNTTPTTYSVSTTSNINRMYEFRVVAQSGVCSSVTSSSATMTVYSNATGTPSPALIETYGPATGSFSLSNYAGSFSKWQQSTNSGSTWADAPLPNANSSYNYSHSSVATTLYRGQMLNDICGTLTSPNVTIIVSPVPAMNVVGNVSPVLALGDTITLQSASTYWQYQWFRDGNLVATSGATYAVTKPGLYQLKVRASSTASQASATALAISVLGYQTDNTTNMEVTTVVRKPGVTTTPAVDLYTLSPSEISQSIVYSDDLARPTQSIAIGQSPLQKDIVVPYVYDSASAVSYLPFVATSTGGLKKSNALSTQSTFYQNTPQVASSTTPYTKSLIENSPLGRITEQGRPGTDWTLPQASRHTLQPLLMTNSGSNVRIWTMNGPSGYYGADVLSMNKAQDENGNSVYIFSDRMGHMVLKRVQLDETLNLNDTNVFTAFLETYYVYDTRGNLKLQVPPKAVALINQGMATWSAAFRDKWCFIYKYDLRNRLVEKKTPDAAWTYYAYDPLGRLVLSQDGNLRSLGKWAFIKYDAKGRVVMTGLYANSNDRATVQTTLLDTLYAGPTKPYFETRGSQSHGYTNRSFPTTTTNTEIYSVSYYDNYDFDNAGGDDWGYSPQSLAGEGTAGSSFGMPTGAKMLVVGTSTWLYTYKFYDKFGRAIQTRTNNYLSTTVDNLVTVVYDFEGKPTIGKTYHNAGGTNQVTVVERYSYDFAGRLTDVYHKVNALSEQKVAHYEYNKLGQMIDKKLHNTSGSNYLQSVDYRYTITGAISSINNATLTNDGTTNNESNDYFGIELMYNTVDAALGNTALYNGNISAVKWKAGGAELGAEDVRSYNFTYDKSDRLKGTTFKKTSDTGAWTQDLNGFNEAQTYDHNGNILTLQRNRKKTTIGTDFKPVSSTEALDNLVYTYSSSLANQLLKVEDSGLTDGFNNAANVATEYTYATDGSLTADQNKGISTITYNALKKPEVITYSGSPTKTSTYTYDAAGNKVRVVTNDGTTTTTTDYVSGFVYENNNLSFFSSPEGRVVKSGASFEYQYFISDHQGNTRVVFTSVAQAALNVKATYEPAVQTTEATYFLNYGAADIQQNELFDHTDVSGSTYQYAQRLTGGYNSQVGIARSLKVYPGDSVKAVVYAKYWTLTETATNLTTFGAALASAFGVSAGSTGEALKAYNALTNYGSAVAAGSGPAAEDDPPMAYINVLLFDQNFNFIEASVDRIGLNGEQVGSSPKTPFDTLLVNVAVREPGYAYIFISNEHPTLVDVYFDDMEVTHKKGSVIQYNEYYSFGLQNMNSWTRENAKGNNFLYNEGSELNTLTGLYDTYFRGFDPVLGRFHQVDPMADSYGSFSTYHYAGNNPINMNDPTGAMWSADWEAEYTGNDFVYRKDRMSQGSMFGDIDGGATIMAAMGFPSIASGGSYYGGYNGAVYNELPTGSWEEMITQRAKEGDPAAVMAYGKIHGTPINSNAVATVLKMVKAMVAPGSYKAEVVQHNSVNFIVETAAQGATILMRAALGKQSSEGGWFNVSEFMDLSVAFSLVITQGRNSDLGPKDLSAVLFIAEASLFNIEAYAQYGLARNAAIRSNFTRATGYYWNPGRLKGSDQFLKGLKVMGGTLAKFTFYGGVAMSVAGVIQNPTMKNAAWAAADISVGLIGLHATAIAGVLTTAGLAIPGLNLIIAGGALIYSGYRLYQAFNED